MSTFTRSSISQTQQDHDFKNVNQDSDQTVSLLNSQQYQSSLSSSSSSEDRKKKKKRRRTKKHQKSQTKLLNKLCKEAIQHELKALRLEGTPEEKRKATVLWIETIKDLLRTNTQTSEILKDYPKLPKQLPSNENKALDSILRAHMAHNVKQMLNGTPRDDGLSTLLRIQQLPCTSFHQRQK